MAHPAFARVRAICFALACALSGAAMAQDFSPDELRKAAALALRDGQPQVARQLGEALLRRDPDDLNALLILSRAARDMGDVAPAREAARRAWRLAQTDREKYSTALITAQVLATQGKRTRSQLWLRRAAEHAPTEALRARAQRDFRYVKRRNPWQTNLSFTLAPNSNINNGSARDQSRLNYAVSELLFGEPIEFDLSEDAQAIAGIEIGAALRTRYRFAQTPKAAHDAKLSLSYRTFQITDDLSDESVRGSDFAFGTAAVGYGYRRINMERKGEFAADLEGGQTWYGGARYGSYLRGQAQQTLTIDAGQRFRFGGELERQWGQSTPDRDLARLSASITQRFQTGNAGYLGLVLTQTQSPEPRSEYTDVTLRTGLAFKKPIMGAALQIGLGASWRNYDISRDDPSGRQDSRLFADITATFREIDYYGFNPSVTLSASTTDSNIGLYDVNRVGLNIGIKSAF
ncbi:MAG: surface lipoprotein assembly modifier [Pseudomonadota bacterium]